MDDTRRRHPDPTVEQWLDLAAQRHAEAFVIVRHLAGKLHAKGGLDHGRMALWTQCAHKDCRRAAILVGDWHPPEV